MPSEEFPDTPQQRPLLNRGNNDVIDLNDEEDDDEIQFISGTAPPIITSERPTLDFAHRLLNQHIEQQRRIRREHENQHENTPTTGFYHNENAHINDDGPILITSDTEDNMDSFNSEIVMIESAPTTRLNMSLSADRESINSARIAQRQHLRRLSRRVDAADTTGEDEVEFVGERDLPDIQIFQPHPATGFQLHTPSGSLFVPTETPDEVRSAGLRSVNYSANPSMLPFISSFRRSQSPHTSIERQARLRRQQQEANRRARLASMANSTVAGRVRRRPQRASAVNSRESSTIRHRSHPRLNLDNIRAFANFGAFIQLMRSDGENGGFDAEAVPDNIMQILQQRDDAREEERIRSRTTVATKEKEKMAISSRVDASHKEKFCNNLGEEGHDDVCVLCGTVFLQGIPHDYNENKDGTQDEIKALLKEGFRSPWRAWEKFNNVELDLSKKVFFSSCGHMYCGRCVNNIMRFRGLTVNQRKDELSKVGKKSNLDRISATDIDFENPGFSSPLKCVADGCNKKFSGKTPFNELYI